MKRPRLLARLRPVVAGSHREASRIRRAEDRDLPQWPRKESFACCAATRDDLGRLCIGWCGPNCERRPRA